MKLGCQGVTRVTHAPTFHFKVAGTSFLAGELVILMRHAREKRAKEVRDLKGEKFETNMAARGLFKFYETFVLFCKKFAHQRVFDVFNGHCECRRQKRK